MSVLRAVPARWLVFVLALAVLTSPLTPVQHAAAADQNLVFAALHVLEDEYVDPVHPVALLNSALATLRKADTIFLEELHKSGWYRKTSQAFAVLLPVQSVGVMGDGRTYENAVCLRCVQTDDFMTADWSRLPEDLLARVATEIINKVKGVNRVVYDISSKPPATIEWE